MPVLYRETCDYCGDSHELNNASWRLLLDIFQTTAIRGRQAMELGVNLDAAVVIICPKCKAKMPARPGVARLD